MRIAVALLFALAACGEDETPARPPGPAVPAPAATIGGQPRDAFLLQEDMVAAIARPRFTRLTAEAFTAAGAGPPLGRRAHEVLAVAQGDRVYAFPLLLMRYHRVVCLARRGQPLLLVTYAPIHARARVWRVPDFLRVRAFGVAGYHLDELLLYDDRTHSLWRQESGACIEGWAVGKQLAPGPAVTRTNLAALFEAHADVRVLLPPLGMQDRYEGEVADLAAPVPPGPGLTRLGDPDAPRPDPQAFWIAPEPPPTLDAPEMVPGTAASFLEAADHVAKVTVAGRTLVYPVYALAHNHAVNDDIADTPLLVALCDLCSTVTAWRAAVDGRRLTFDLAGAYQGSALLVDRQTGSQWLVATGACLRGWYAGARLERLPATWTTWGALDEVVGDVQVLVPEDVPEEILALRPGGLRGAARLPRSVAGSVTHRDDRLAPHALVWGVVRGGVARAYPFDVLRAHDGPLADELGGEALTLRFDPAADTVTGDPSGLQIEWYAWVALYPETTLYGDH